MNIRKKLMVGALSIIVFMMAVSIIIASFVIYRQNLNNANHVLKQSMNVCRDNIIIMSEKLLNDTRQMATINNMGSKISFLTEQKSEDNLDFTRSSYEEVIADLYNTGLSSSVWQISVYDMDRDLMAFFLKNEEGVQLGYPASRKDSEYRLSVLKNGEKYTRGKFQNQHQLPLLIKQKFVFDVPVEESVEYRQVGEIFSIVSYAPSFASVYSDEKEDMVLSQVGFVVAVKMINRSFVKRMARLTDTQVNIFSRNGLSVGTLPEYKKFDLSSFKNNMERWDLRSEQISYSDITLSAGGFFQGILPVYNGQDCTGAIVTVYSKGLAISNAKQLILILCLISLLCILLVVPLIFMFSNRFISKPINHLQELMLKLAEGDLTVKSTVNSRDELGSLSASSNLFIENFRNLIKNLITEVQNLNDFAEGMRTLSEDMAVKLNQMSSQSTIAVDVTYSTAERLKSMEKIASSVNEQIVSLAVSSDQISEDMNTIGVNVNDAAKSVNLAAVSIESMYAAQKHSTTHDDRNSIASDSEGIMIKLGEAAKEIGDVVSAIKDIAGQTNLLALNATIESARAGEAGKGFGVVAGEVKELAGQTSTATEDISERVSGIQQNTEKAIEAINTVVKSVNEIDVTMGHISTSVEGQVDTLKDMTMRINGIVSSAEEISEQAKSASNGTDTVSENISDVNVAATSTSDEAALIKSQAAELMQMAAKLHDRTEKFKVD